MSAAEVISIREETSPYRYPWSALIQEAAEHHNLHSNQDIAEWVAGKLDWRSLSRHEQNYLMTLAVRQSRSGSMQARRTALSTELDEGFVEGAKESSMRLTVAGSIWDATWAEVNYKETRELTLEDVRTLKLAFQLRTHRALARVRFFAAMEALMVKHGAKKAGVLETKGVELPSVKVGAGE